MHHKKLITVAVLALLIILVAINATTVQQLRL
jgi:hypothetical protein